MVSDEDATYIFPTDPPWLRPNAHNTAAATPLALAPTRACHQDSEHPGWTGLWYGVGHPGGEAQRLRRDDTHQDQDLHGAILLEPAWIQGDLLDGTAGQRGRISACRRTFDKEEARRVGYRFHTLPRTKCCKLQARHWTNLDPTRRRVPNPVDARAPARPGGVPQTFQGPHCHWGPERAL